MRKYWFAYLAKAIVVMPGGFGTLDEFMEIVTLVQTLKIKKKLPIVLFGTEFWSEVLDFEPLVRWGMISPEDLDLFFRTDSVDEAYAFLTRELEANVLSKGGHAVSSPSLVPEEDVSGELVEGEHAP
jgi:predicted Rossmann-fold nucleotide-binding protein